MKDKISALLIILLFTGFVTFTLVTTNKKTVLNVVTPTVIQIDLNKNHIVDENETICIPKIHTYTSNLSAYEEELKGTSFEKGIAIGYLADEFAHTTLDGKDVKLKFTGESNTQCRFAEIITEKGNYSNLLEGSGFAMIDGKPIDESKFNKIKDDAAKLHLVIFNHKSDKFHTLNCKYGQIAHDAVILSGKDLPQTAKPCKFCHITPSKTAKTSSQIAASVLPPPNIITSGNIKVILTDFTKILKPDKNCSHEVCKEFVSMVNNAENSIDIALYGWTDIPKVRTAIENAISRGVEVRVVYDTKSSGQNYYPDTETFAAAIGKSRSDRIDGNSKLTNFLMHNKFAIFDRQKVFTGSMNFSQTGFSGFNQNSVIIINSAETAKIYNEEFEQMYSGKFHTLKAKTRTNSILFTDGSKLSIYFSPQDKGITSKLVPLVNSAQKYIYMPAFVITHRAITTALINAFKRGVDVKVIIDATNTHARNSTMQILRAAGIPVKVENYAGKMHSKVLIIDDKYVVTGSTNFSNSGENKNDENMLIIESTKIAKFYGEFFMYLWSKIPDKYLKFNPPAESKYSIGSCTDGIDNDYDGKIDAEDDGCR